MPKIQKSHQYKGIKRKNGNNMIINYFIVISILLSVIEIVNPLRQFQLYLQNSEITLTINGIGEQYILNYGDSDICPDYIYLNDDEENNIKNTDNCRTIIIPSEENQINQVKLIWNTKLSSLNGILANLQNLIEVDLSKFDASEVEDMTYMFQDSSSLESINFGNFNTSKVKSMSCMFYGCSSLTNLDLSSFDTSKVTVMRLLFFGCSSLTSLNIENFDTSETLDMEFLFFNCSKLQYLSLKNFDTSKVEKMNFMFCQCNSLEYLDLSTFNTYSLIDMDYMFSYSERLTSINLYNFDTSKVFTMKSLFEGCLSLNYLNISNFDTSNVNYLDNMFTNCLNLKSLDLFHFNTHKLLSASGMFSDCKSLTSLNISNFDTSQITDMSSFFKNCQNLLNLDLSSFETSKVANMESMFEGCTSLSSLNFKNINTNSLISLDNMFKDCINLEYINFESYIDQNNSVTINNILQNIPNNIVICINQNNNIGKLMEMINNKTCPTIYCGNDWKSKKKLISENNICIDDKEIDSSETIISSAEIKEDTNLIKKSEYKSTYITEYSIINHKSYFLENNTSIKDTYSNNIYYNNTQNRTELIENIRENIIDLINVYNIDGGNDYELKQNDITIEITTTNNQKNKEKNINKTVIDLGNCEYKLKEEYNISNNSYLYIIKIDIKQDNYNIPKIEYEVYYPLDGNNLTKLNLTVCKNEKIEFLIPVTINDNIEKYNISSDYYNDICSTTTSNYGTDISLSDRKNDFINNNMTLCEENCNLISYDTINEKAKCSCDIKLNVPSLIDDIKIDKNKLLESFTDIHNIINIKILKCYKTAFNIDSLKNNYGFYILSFIIILYFICLTLFYTKYYPLLKDDINKIVSSLLGLNDINLQKKEDNDKNIYEKKEINNDFIILDKINNNNKSESKKVKKKKKRKEKE